MKPLSRLSCACVLEDEFKKLKLLIEQAAVEKNADRRFKKLKSAVAKQEKLIEKHHEYTRKQGEAMLLLIKRRRINVDINCNRLRTVPFEVGLDASSESARVKKKRKKK